jgi:hypothetical protein
MKVIDGAGGDACAAVPAASASGTATISDAAASAALRMNMAIPA